MGSRSLGSLWTPTTHVLEPPPPPAPLFPLLFFYESFPSVSAGIRTLASQKIQSGYHTYYVRLSKYQIPGSEI